MSSLGGCLIRGGDIMGLSGDRCQESEMVGFELISKLIELGMRT